MHQIYQAAYIYRGWRTSRAEGCTYMQNIC